MVVNQEHGMAPLLFIIFMGVVRGDEANFARQSISGKDLTKNNDNPSGRCHGMVGQTSFRKRCLCLSMGYKWPLI